MRKASSTSRTTDAERRREIGALRDELARRDGGDSKSSLELQMTRQQLVAREDEVRSLRHQVSTTRAECQMRLHMAWVEGYAGKMPTEYANTLHTLKADVVDEKMHVFGDEPPHNTDPDPRSGSAAHGARGGGGSGAAGQLGYADGAFGAVFAAASAAAADAVVPGDEAAHSSSRGGGYHRGRNFSLD